MERAGGRELAPVSSNPEHRPIRLAAEDLIGAVARFVGVSIAGADDALD